MTPAVNGSTWAGGRLASSVLGWVTLPHAASPKNEPKSSETANIHLKDHFAIEVNSHTTIGINGCGLQGQPPSDAEL
jgi:hypothetical protein